MKTGRSSDHTKQAFRIRGQAAFKALKYRLGACASIIRSASFKGQTRKTSGLPLELIFLAATLGTIYLSLSLVIREAGWPYNHEYLSFMQRTAIYADHFRHGDIFPIWASSDGFGEGTPLPLFYHKAFYYLSGVIFLLTGAMKASIVITIAVFMLVGAYGLRLCVQRLTPRRDVAVIVPLTFLLANYTFTDWLVRGAMAEFSAVMIIPWLIWWCIVLLQDRRISFAVVPILFLLIQAHNVTALFAMIMVAVAYVVFLTQAKAPGFRSTLKHGVISVVALTALMVPQLTLQEFFLKDYDPSKITQNGFLASQSFRPFSQYIWNSGFWWLHNWMHMTVQLDLGIWVALVAVPCVAVYWIWRKRNPNYGNRSFRDQLPILVFLFVSLIVYGLLQLSASAPVYENVSILQFLQFPWRLLAFITPLGMLIAIFGLASLQRRSVRLATLGAWLLVFLALSPVFSHFQFGGFSEATIAGDMSVKGGGLAGIGEYYPKVYDGRGNELSGLATVQMYEQAYMQKRQTQVLQGSCHITERPEYSLEVSSLTFHYACKTRSLVALPISYNRLSIITDESAVKQLGAIRRSTDPRILVDLHAGTGMIKVELPSLDTAYEKAVSHLREL